MSQLTSPPAPILADTVIRTVELGVRITDAALAGETTVLWSDLLTDGPGRCPGCGRTRIGAATTSWPTPPTGPRTAPPKPSTVASKRCAATPWGFRNLINYRIRSLLHSGNLAL